MIEGAHYGCLVSIKYIDEEDLNANFFLVGDGFI
jgi:hypothetical protein